MGKRAVEPLNAVGCMQSFYPPSFDRDMACTEAEWLGWLPAAIGDYRWERGTDSALVFIDQGHLRLSWQTAAPRVIALIRLPRLLVQFQFDGLGDDKRLAFMKRFDLYMQRGGG